MTPSGVPLALRLTPGGHLQAVRGGDESSLSEAAAERIENAFSAGTGPGLLRLGAEEISGELGPCLSFWRDLARLYLTRLCTSLDIDDDVAAGREVPLADDEARRLLEASPPMVGIEYLSEEVVRRAWSSLGEALREEARVSKRSASDLLQERSPLWKTLGRVFFHLAENRSRPDRPFAFLATYTSRLSAQGKVQHVPLGRAVQDRASAASREGLLKLLTPLQKASAESPLLKELLDSGRVFQTLAWTPDEAHRFLLQAPLFEEKGISVRLPDWWNARRPPRLRVGVTVGGDEARGLGADSLLDFSVELSLEGEPIPEEEWRRILAASGSLAMVKGRWVEVDREKLGELLRHWKSVERQTAREGISFLEGMRLLARLPASSLEGDPDEEGEGATSGWVSLEPGRWLRKVLDDLRRPGTEGSDLEGLPLRAELRPYQVEGLQWLHLLHRLRLGGCLADDMGLGKTVQVIALLLLIRRERESGRGAARKGASSRPPALLVIPASLIGNWKSECARFAPDLRLHVAHPSESSAPVDARPSDLDDLDLVLTTYGMLPRQPWMREEEWGLVVLDEAQAIKNPSTRQAQAVKSLRAGHRLALTGTPVENRLFDLWSIFDFLSPGLLGNAREFARLTARSGAAPVEAYARVRALVRPYILRRLKSDRRIIADLPDKEEVKVFCGLRRTQAVLYQQAVEELGRTLGNAEGIRRRGLILAFLTRFKQICNHPSQWTGDGGYEPAESGKMARLVDLCEEIASRQEKALVFTQYKELTLVLESVLKPVFARPGLVLDGDTPVRKRRELVEEFQREDGPPFLVLSLRAGGTGLNLTAASHVIHFDRWWNPAVENQATDRAYRIGQKRNVLVHKFVCQGTVEEKIDALIESKQGMAEEVLKDGAQAVLTEMGNEELIRMVTLDRKRAVLEG